MGNILRNGLSRVHEGNEPVDDLAVFHPRRCNLRQLIMGEREPRGFRIQNNDIIIEPAEIALLGPFGKRLVARDNLRRRSVADKFFSCLSEGVVSRDIAQPMLSRRPWW